MSSSADIITGLSEKVSEWQLNNLPEFATYVGFNSDDRSLDPYTEKFYTDREKLCRDVLNALEPLTEDGLCHENVITLRMLRYYAEMYMESLKWEPYLHGLNYWEGPDWCFTSNISRLPFKNETDYKNYIARLQKLPQAMEDITNLMRIGIEKSITHYKTSVEGVISRLENFTKVEIKDSVFFSPFLKIPESIPDETRNNLYIGGQEAIKCQVYPSFLKTTEFLSQVYLKSCRPDPGLSTLPGGRDRYAAYLKFYSDWYGTIEELHDLGVQEVKKINKRIEKIKEHIGFQGGHDKLIKHLESKEDLYFKSREDLLSFCDNLIYNRINPKLKLFFSEPPYLPLRFEFKGESQPAPAIYNAPMRTSGDHDKQEGLLSFTGDLNCLPSYTLPSLMLHETDPGHHFQACYVVNDDRLPNFRRYKDDRRYFESPARFPMNNAYTEGWGLYCECLGEEMGVYQDDYELLGYLMQDIKRAIRIVVDTGIHAFGWSEEKAFKYMKENAPYSDSGARGEIKRYITWPGQACSYKVGFLKIVSLRRKAETILGKKFDIKKFHNACLTCGQVPLDILEGIINKHIEEQLQEC